MKNSADLGGYYPPRPKAEVDNTPLDLQNSSYPTQPHSIIAKYDILVTKERLINNINYYRTTTELWSPYCLNSVSTDTNSQ